MSGFTGDPHIRFTKLTKKVQRGSSLLAKGHLKGIFPAPLPERFLHIVRHTVEAISRTKTVYALVGTLSQLCILISVHLD